MLYGKDINGMSSNLINNTVIANTQGKFFYKPHFFHILAKEIFLPPVTCPLALAIASRSSSQQRMFNVIGRPSHSSLLTIIALLSPFMPCIFHILMGTALKQKIACNMSIRSKTKILKVIMEVG